MHVRNSREVLWNFLHNVFRERKENGDILAIANIVLKFLVVIRNMKKFLVYGPK